MPRPVPGCEILLDGAPIELEIMRQLLDVTVRDSLLLPDSALVRFRDPKGTLVGSDKWSIGATLDVKLAGVDEDTFTTAFSGEIVAIEPEYGQGDVIVAFRAYDKAWRLNRVRKSATYKDVTAADMVKIIAAEAGLGLGTIQDGGPKYDVFQQSMETNWEFCWRLARLRNFEFVVQANTCHFRERKTEAPAATLTRNATREDKALLSFKPRVSGIGQVQTVEVRNHDPKSRQPVVSKVGDVKIPHKSPAIESRAQAISKLGAGAVVVADRVTDAQDEAQEIAQTTLDRLASSFIEADGAAHGTPAIRAGSTVKLDGVHQFSGEYVLSETTHRFAGGTGKYRTSFVISGRTSHRFRDLLRTDGATDWGSSLVIGIVTNNKETDGSTEAKLGRVKVKYRGLGDDIESGWARVVVPHAGKDRGMFFLPQVGDEVVVAFEHGDTRRPLIIGSLFNGQDKPPAELLATTEAGGGKDPLFGVKTPHEAFVESTQQMTLRSHEKMTIEVKKDGQKGTGDYTLKAEGKIDESAGTSIKHAAKTTYDVEAGSSVKIKGTGAITIESSAGITLKGTTVDIQANAAVNIKGQIINLG
ncbi:MAG TPA: VgrG-related protein [Solirubrobacteraceae bacterium]|nr:VgrG-related protein [Solirubrobacteraceae bacterium]